MTKVAKLQSSITLDEDCTVALPYQDDATVDYDALREDIWDEVVESTTPSDLTVDDVMDWVGYPLLGLVPEDRNVMLAAVHDRPVLLYARRCAAAKAFRRMAKRLQGLPVPLAGL